MTAPEDRTVVDGLPWRRVSKRNPAEHVEESWNLDIDGIYVWVKRYEYGFKDWRGWRIGRGGSPLLSLNGGKGFKSRRAAMAAAKRVAQVTARDHLVEAQQKLADAVRSMEEVVVTL